MMKGEGRMNIWTTTSYEGDSLHCSNFKSSDITKLKCILLLKKLKCFTWKPIVLNWQWMGNSIFLLYKKCRCFFSSCKVRPKNILIILANDPNLSSLFPPIRCDIPQSLLVFCRIFTIPPRKKKWEDHPSDFLPKGYILNKMDQAMFLQTALFFRRQQ